jgi:predicted DCC family thiol-disulfide oxidoreductase YuxK
MNIPDPVKQNNYIILFDGVCNLCSGFMQFVYNRATKNIFKFAWLKDEKSKEILNWLKLSSDNFESIILIESGNVYYKSNAFLRIIRFLPFPWPILRIGYFLPLFIRDTIYDFVARNRYRWFGKKNECLVQTGDLLKRFL